MHPVAVSVADAHLKRFELHSLLTHFVSVLTANDCKVLVTCVAQGTSKSGLMGFCDCAPGETKVLRVLFLFNKEPHMAILSDQVF